MSKPAAILFDAYGTLFDIFAVEAGLETMFPGKGLAISQLWRVRLIDYTRLTTLSGGWRAFESLNGDAFDYACEAESASPSAPQRAQALAWQQRPPAHPEVPAALAALRASGHRLGVLTNGDSAPIAAALAAADIRGHFEHVLSVERVRKFKPAPEAYQLGPDAFGAPAGEIVFVSSNGWDAVAAAAFGYRAYWVNRYGAPRERFGAAPAGEGRAMGDLVGFVGET
jgi:2-haloacid dehalogenase